MTFLDIKILFVCVDGFTMLHRVARAILQFFPSNVNLVKISHNPIEIYHESVSNPSQSLDKYKFSVNSLV